MRRSKWITATSGTAYEPKRATPAEVEAYMEGQKSAIVVSSNVSSSGLYMVAKNTKTGQLLFSGEGCLLPENGWKQIYTGTCEQCLQKIRRIKSGIETVVL